MRIIAGKFKGRRFSPPSKNFSTRPTTDYARESLFNILHNSYALSECSFLDLFSGFGLISLEAVSRGVDNIVLVEQNYHCINFIKTCIADLGVEDNIRAVRMDVFKFIANSQQSFDIVFADPPYDHQKMATIPDLIFDAGLVKEQGMLILEHGQNTRFNETAHFRSLRKYGQSIFSFFSS